MKVWMLFLLMFSYSAFSSELSQLKLNPEFEEYLTQAKTKSNLVKTRGALNPKTSATVPSKIQSKMMNALLGSPINSPIPVDGEDSLLYEEIRRNLETSHQQIGLENVQNINALNRQFNLGTSNFSGFSWQKPFGAVHVKTDRQVLPNVFAQNWLVTDTFTISVEATTFLERLADAGLTGLDASEIGAYAGITFNRVYTYWHYANSYEEGLSSDFSMMFLPFTRFNQEGLERLANDEIIKREDIWTAKAGGLISTPPLYNLSFSAGALAEFDYQNVTTVQSNHNSEHRFKVGVLAKKSAMAGATMALQLNFFDLLKLTLLSYDLNYTYASGKEFTLGFKNDEWPRVKADPEQGPEFRNLLRGFGTVQKLEPYVVRLDESTSSAVEQRGSVLIWGKLQKTKTEQVRVIKDNVVHVFYKNYAQSVKVVQNIFSRIFSAIVYKLLKFPVGASNAAIYSRQLTLEYEASHPQAADPRIIRVDSTEKFSFVISQYYNAAKTDRWIDRKFKNDLIWFTDNFTTLPKSYKTDIRNNVLKGPMMIESIVRVEKAGVNYLLAMNENDVFGLIADACNSMKKHKWTNEFDRREMLQYDQFGKDGCTKDMGLKFLGFKSDYLANYLKPSLAKFKDFLAQYYKNAENLISLQLLFGEENVFINGRLQAKTSNGTAFNTTFSTGQFRGLGVIDNFKRATGSRVPASIVSE